MKNYKKSDFVSGFAGAKQSWKWLAGCPIGLAA